MLSGHGSPGTSEKDPSVTSRSAANAVPFGPTNEFFPWRHRFAVFTALATFVLIFVGGLVTSTGSSLSVPDWPLSYGQLFPPMVGGILYEHGHRMIASTVGFLTVILAVWLWRTEKRAWLRRLGLIAVVIVAASLASKLTSARGESAAPL